MANTTNNKKYKINEYVVYPSHGVGKITDILEQEIAGMKLELYVIYFEEDKMTLRVPTNKVESTRMRAISDTNLIDEAFTILKSNAKIKKTMWSRRAQEYEAKISSGKIYELAEVVRDLNKGDDLMIDQSYSERQLFEKAYDRILSEFQIVLNVSREDTQKKLDKALKRNVNKEIKEDVKTTKSSSTTELPVEEPISETDDQIED